MVKFITRCGLVLGVLLVAACMGIYAWLRSGPISNQELTLMLERALSANDGSLRADIGEVEIDWEHLDRLGSLQIKHLVLQDEAGNIFANFPNVRASINPLSLLRLGPVIDEVVVIRPQFYLEKDEEGIWKVGLNADDRAVPLAQLLQSFSSGADSGYVAVGFETLRVEGAQLYVSDAGKGTMLSSTAASIEASRRGSIVDIQLKAPFSLDDHASTIVAAAVIDAADNQIATDFRVDHLPLALMCKFMHCPPHLGASGTFTGRIAPSFADGALHELELIGIAEDVTARLEDWFEAPLLIRRAKLHAVIRKEAKEVELFPSELTLEDTIVRARGKLTQTAQGTALTGYGETTAPLAIDKLKKYWPITKAPEARNWMDTMLSKGDSPHGHIHLNIKPGDLAQEILPDSALRATVDVRDIAVNYLKGFPKITVNRGKVHFTARGMRVEASEATALKGTRLSHLKLIADDLYHPNVPMKVTFDVSAPAADAVKILALEPFTFDDGLALTSSITGRAQGNIALGFNAFSANDDGKPHFENVAYDISLNLADVAQKNLAHAVDISDLNVALKASNQEFTLNGSTRVNQHPLTLAMKQEAAGIGLEMRGILPVLALRALAGEHARWLEEGAVKASVTLRLGKEDTRIERAEIDLSKAALTIAELGVSKPLGQKASLSVLPNNEAGSLTLRADLGVLSAKGNLQMSDDGRLTLLHLDQVKSAQNDFALSYKAVDQDAHRITLRGNSIDLRGAYASEENGLLADFPNIKLELDVSILYLTDTPFTEVRGMLDCVQGPCRYADISAIVGKGNIAARIDRDAAGVRTLTMQSGDAGDVFKALDITDRMYGGKLEISGTYDDAKPESVLHARLLVNDFTLKNSEILGRILAIGSLSGLANVLTGSGIDFEKLSANVTAQRGVFTIDEGRARGNAMGFTVKGNVNTADTTLKLRGVLVPAFLLNSMLGNIPILGELVGGEGEGLIAFNYSVKGSYANPEVMVNPLSGLTPGFLRGIFTAFDDEGEPVQAPNEKPAAATKP